MKDKEVEIVKFGSTPSEIDSLANKVLFGEKIATSSLLDYYILGLKRRSEKGDKFSILDSFDKEIITVQIERTEIIKFGDITEEFAVEEGDKSLQNWLAIHKPYYSHLLAKIGKELSSETLLLCEWFRIIEV